MVDARGGALHGSRHGGVRVVVPPGQALMPTRITCKLVRKERLLHPPPLMDGEALASRVLEMGPTGTTLLGSVKSITHCHSINFTSSQNNQQKAQTWYMKYGMVYKYTMKITKYSDTPYVVFKIRSHTQSNIFWTKIFKAVFKCTNVNSKNFSKVLLRNFAMKKLLKLCVSKHKI